MEKQDHEVKVCSEHLLQPLSKRLQALPTEIELKPKAKGGVLPSCTEMLTLDTEALRMMVARIWGILCGTGAEKKKSPDHRHGWQRSSSKSPGDLPFLSSLFQD